MKVRTRFAPSPTGYMHIGNLRTALYAYLIAKHDNGDFLLRIEDTDKNREVEGAIDIIYNSLKLAGLKHDEGPDIGGPVGPYVQSERVKSGIYMEYAKKLEAVQVTVRAKAGNGGKLFGAVTSEAISKALREQFDMDIEKNKIVQAEPIKSFGTYTVKAKLGYEVNGNISVLVVEG